MLKNHNVEIRGEIYLLNFGLKQLIELAQIPDINTEEHFDSIMRIGLIPPLPPSFTFSKEERAQLMPYINKIFSFLEIPSSQTIEEWYRKGLGEIGLSLSDFYCLTPYQLDLAYEGYLRRAELQANLTRLSVMKAQNNDYEPIVIVPDKGCSLGSLNEREKVFKNLHLEEKLDEL